MVSEDRRMLLDYLWDREDPDDPESMEWRDDLDAEETALVESWGLCPGCRDARRGHFGDRKGTVRIWNGIGLNSCWSSYTNSWMMQFQRETGMSPDICTVRSRVR